MNNDEKVDAHLSKENGFWANFKAFALRGNVIDLAIGIIVGTTFNTLVTSLVNNVVMPPIGKLLGNVDFSNLYVNLSSMSYPTLADAQAAGAPVITYGTFITDLINFLILALTIFIIVKYVLRYRLEKR